MFTINLAPVNAKPQKPTKNNNNNNKVALPHDHINSNMKTKVLSLLFAAVLGLAGVSCEEEPSSSK